MTLLKYSSPLWKQSKVLSTHCQSTSSARLRDYVQSLSSVGRISALLRFQFRAFKFFLKYHTLLLWHSFNLEDIQIVLRFVVITFIVHINHVRIIKFNVSKNLTTTSELWHDDKLRYSDISSTVWIKFQKEYYAHEELLQNSLNTIKLN